MSIYSTFQIKLVTLNFINHTDYCGSIKKTSKNCNNLFVLN